MPLFNLPFLNKSTGGLPDGVSRPTWVVLDVTGPYPERQPTTPLQALLNRTDTLEALEARIEKLRSAEWLHGVLVKISEFTAAPATAHAIRSLIAHLGEHKRVVAYVPQLTMTSLIAASGAKEIAAPESGGRDAGRFRGGTHLPGRVPEKARHRVREPAHPRVQGRPDALLAGAHGRREPRAAPGVPGRSGGRVGAGHGPGARRGRQRGGRVAVRRDYQRAGRPGRRPDHPGRLRGRTGRPGHAAADGDRGLAGTAQARHPQGRPRGGRAGDRHHRDRQEQEQPAAPAAAGRPAGRVRYRGRRPETRRRGQGHQGDCAVREFRRWQRPGQRPDLA